MVIVDTEGAVSKTQPRANNVDVAERYMRGLKIECNLHLVKQSKNKIST